MVQQPAAGGRVGDARRNVATSGAHAEVDRIAGSVLAVTGRADGAGTFGRVAAFAAGPDLPAEHGALTGHGAMAGDRAKLLSQPRRAGRAEQPDQIGRDIAFDQAGLPDREAGWGGHQIGRQCLGVRDMAENAAVEAGRRKLPAAQDDRIGGKRQRRQQPERDHRKPDQQGQHRPHIARLWHAGAAGGKGVNMLANHVLFLDGEALVIDKPAGLPVDPPRDGGLSLENHLATLTFGFQRWPTAVHRLDRDTSGCLLLARNPKAHARFQQAFEGGTVQKRYLAVLDAAPAESAGVIDLPLVKISSAEAGWRMRGDPGGKRAVTAWRVLSVLDGRALVEFRPETGRTHQIRVHAAEALGAAVVGDPVYGRADPAGMLLHAAALTVPRGGKAAIDAVAPWPERFRQAGFDGD